MEILFSKITENRKKEFRITTQIVEKDNNLFVMKTSEPGFNHAKTIYDNNVLLKKYLNDYIDVGEVNNNTLIVPYFAGKTLSHFILEKKEKQAIEIFEKLISLVPVKPFSEFESSEKKFYEEQFGDDELSFVVTNFDFNFFNIIIGDKKIKLIDNEWVFTYPVPRDAVIYRALKQIAVQYPFLNFDLNKWIKHFNINEKNIEKFENMEIEFQNYVLLDHNFRSSLQKKEIFVNSNKLTDLIDENNEIKDKNVELEKALDDKQQALEKKEKEIEKMTEESEKIQNELKSKTDKVIEYENSTTFKMLRPYWKIRDKIFPLGSRRRLFLKLISRAIKHPIWFIKHLNPINIIKFNRSLKSEGAGRCLERFETYEKKNIDFSKNFKVELFEMKERAEYPVLKVPHFDKPTVSIVIPVYNQFPYTYGCIESIIKNSQGVKYEIIIGDDCSTDQTKQLNKYVENIKVVHNKKNLRFLLNCNNAAKSAVGKYILFLNNDTNVQSGWLSSLIDTIESSPKIGMVGSKLVYPDGKLQEAGGILWKDGSAWNFGSRSDPTSSEYNYRKPVDYISGAAIMLSKKLWNLIGGFDLNFVPAYCEDSDLAFEVRKAGYEVIYDPFSVVVHYEGVSNGTDTSTGVKKYQVENSKKLYQKWKSVLAKHPDNGIDVFKARERCYNKKMILVVDHYVPEFDKDAGSRTVFSYLNVFVDLGYSVKFIGENFYKSEPYTEILEKRGIEVLYGPYYANNYKSWLKLNGKYFDYVFINRPHIASKFIDDIVDTCKNAKIIYYGHDLHFLRLQREYEVNKDKHTLQEAEEWHKMENAIYDKVDLIYYPSAIERDEVQKISPKYNVKVLQPYLYNEFNTGYNPETRKNLLFVGGFRHGANFDGIKWFLNEIFPSIVKKDPSIVINIAGSFPPQELMDMANDNIKVLGYVDDDKLAKLYEQSKLIVVPLRFGAGIKGKIIEAMRYGVPVITTDIGAEGIDAKALCIDNNFEQLLSLYRNNKRLIKQSHAGIEFVKAHYSYESALRNIATDFKELDYIKK